MLDTFAPLTFLGNHDVTRLASRLDDQRHLAHALAILLTVGGTPSIYYGDEQGRQGIKEERRGGDDAIRPAFPTQGPIGLPSDGSPIHDLHSQLIRLRRQHRWLHRARTRPLHLSNRQLIYESRLGDHQIVVALNLDDTPSNRAIPARPVLLAGTGTLNGADDSAIELALPPHGWAILGAERDALDDAAGADLDGVALAGR